MKYEIIFSGIGGQGVILAGSLLGEAAVCCGLRAAQTQAYGVSARGGFTKTDVIISDDEILYPYALTPDLIIVLAEPALLHYLNVSNDNCKVIYDSSIIDASKYDLDKRYFGLPIVEIAKELGSARSANILSLGIAASFIVDISLEQLDNVLEKRFRGKILEKNIEILRKGIELGKSVALTR